MFYKIHDVKFSLPGNDARTDMIAKNVIFGGWLLSCPS